MEENNFSEWFLSEEEYNFKVQREIQNILETKPLLDSRYIYVLVARIISYYNNSHKDKVDNSYIEKILDMYDDSLNEKDRFDILLEFSNQACFIKYAKKHYNFFKNKFKETVFVDPAILEESEIIEDIEEKFKYILKDINYKLKLAYLDRTIIYPIYQLFLEDIKFLNNNNICKYHYEYLSCLNFKELIETFINTLKQGATQNEVEIFWGVLNKSKYKNEWNLQYIYNLINNKEILEKLIKSLKQHYKLISINNTISSGFNELFRTKVKEYNICDDAPKDLFSLSYIDSLNKLETLSSYERKSSPLYLKCFQIFLKEFLSDYKDEITKEEVNILEILFQKIIIHKKIFEILAIDNKKSLYHYYKTDRLNLNITLPFEFVKKYNAKQYLELTSLYKDSELFPNDNEMLFVINALEYFGYDLTKKIISKSVVTLYLIITHLSKKQKVYISKIKTLLIELDNLPVSYPLDLVIDLFNLLSKKTLTTIYADNILLSCIYDNTFRTKIKNYNINNNIPEDIYSLSYVKSLNKLEELSSKERKSSLLYLKCFQIFLEEFLINYKDKISKEEINILEALFQRIINHKNIFEILSINNKKSLYHYYKTNRLNLNITLPFELVKNYNAKQYLDLNSLYNKKQSQKTNAVDYNNDNLTIIVSLNMLGYDLNKKIINKDYTQLYYVTNFLSKKSTDYIKKIKPLLLDIINTVVTKEGYTIDSFLTCFTLLYEQSNIKITFTRLKNMVDSISHALLPNNYNIAKNLDKLNFIHKGIPLNEKVEGIKLYDSYRFRLYSSIPDIKGKIDNCEYQMVEMHSEEIISNGIEKYIVKDKLISSCLTPAGKASSCLRHGAINPNGRFFKVTYQNKIVAYSWVWRQGEVLCFDNIEVTDNSYKLDNPEYIIYTAYKKAADAIRKVTNEKEDSGIKLVIIGRNDIDISNSFIDKLESVNDYTESLFKPNSKDNLYLEDSSKKQLILSGKYSDDLKTDDIEPIYKYRRKEIRRFNDFDNEYLRKKINSIYFDYCLENNNKYEKITTNYIDGYLNEDWFVGYKKNNTYDFFYRGNDDRLFKEAKKYLKNKDLKIPSAPNIIKTPKENIDILLDVKNYQFNTKELLSYLQDEKKRQFDLKEIYYTHSPSSLETFSKILEDNAITSAEYGKHEGGNGCNGKNFISVARVNSGSYKFYAGSKTFILTDNICAFSQTEFNKLDIAPQFRNSKYPFRETAYSGELHVLDKINLDKSLGIFISQNRIDELVQIVYLQELFENEIPLIKFEDNTYIDKDVIKKYSKVLK